MQGEKYILQLHADVAVRSFATVEDLADASFAGQQETYQKGGGTVVLIDSVRNCFASLFTPTGVVLGSDPQVFLQPADIVKPGIV